MKNTQVFQPGNEFLAHFLSPFRQFYTFILTEFQAEISPRDLYFLIVRNINLNVVRIATGLGKKEDAVNINEVYGRLSYYLGKSNEHLVQKLLPNTDRIKFKKPDPEHVEKNIKLLRESYGSFTSDQMNDSSSSDGDDFQNDDIFGDFKKENDAESQNSQDKIQRKKLTMFIEIFDVPSKKYTGF